MCNLAITVSSFLIVQGQITQSFKARNIFCNLLFRNSSHSDGHSCNIYLLACDSKSENGMSSTETSPSWAAESTAKLPVMPTWPGTQIKTISLPSLDKFIYNCRIWPKRGWSNFRLNIAVKDDKESDSTKNDFLLEQWIHFRTKRIARNYAVYIWSCRPEGDKSKVSWNILWRQPRQRLLPLF